MTTVSCSLAQWVRAGNGLSAREPQVLIMVGVEGVDMIDRPIETNRQYCTYSYTLRYTLCSGCESMTTVCLLLIHTCQPSSCAPLPPFAAPWDSPQPPSPRLDSTTPLTHL